MSESSVTPLKRCTKCGSEYPDTLEFFSTNGKNRIRLRASCRACDNHRNRLYKREHPEVGREQMRLYRESHRDKIREINKQSRKRHWASFLERCKEYQRRHPDQVRDRGRRYRARKKHAVGDVNTSDIKRQYRLQKGKCYYCHETVGSKYHADHVVPLNRGGSNGPDNIVIACASCNQRKSDKMPHEWVEGGRLL